MKHLKLFFALFAMLALGVGNAWAETSSITFSEKYNANTQVDNTPIAITEGITATFTKGKSTATQYYTSGSAIRWYGGGGLNITSTIGNITAITITYTQTANSVSTDVGSYTLNSKTGSWSGNASSIQFTQSGTSGHCRISKIEVTYTPSSSGGGETPEPDPDPTPDPEEPEPGTGDDATMTAGTNGSACTVNGKEGIKVGSSSKGGDMKVTVPAGATMLHVYAAAWKGVTGLSLNITPTSNVTTTSIALTADAGITNSTPFTLSGNEADYLFDIPLQNITAETTLTFTSSIAKRFVVWGATYETASGDTPEPVIVKTLKSIAVSGQKNTFEQGDIFKFDGTCTATYSVTKDGVAQADETAEVTPTSVSTPNMNTIGEQTVTVTYSEGGVEKTAEYQITITENTVTAGTYCTGTLGYEFWGLNAEKITATANEVDYTVIFDDITINIKNGAKANAYFKADHTRVYSGGYTMTFTAPTNYVITAIAFTANGDNWEGTHTANVGTMTDSKNWAGSASEVTITFGGTCRIKEICVTYEELDETLPTAPTFNPAAGTYNAVQNVTISAEEGTTIHYTLDGTDPTTTSEVYNTPITVSETQTIKAIAVKDEKVSPVASATYTINLPLTTMDQIFAKATAVGGTATSVEITFGNWVVSAVKEDGKTAFVTDGTKGFVIFDKDVNLGFSVGNILSGTATCKVQLYNGFAELTELKSNTAGLSVGSGGTITTQELDATAIETLTGVNTGSLIKINGICSSTESKYYVAGVQIYTALYDFETLKVGAEYNITGIYQQYHSTKEMLPRSAADIEEVVGLPTATIEVSNITMEVGQEKAIEATITPDAAKTTVQYAITSGNEYITLDGTTITAVAAGTATITATIAEKADEYKGATKEFTVTVKPQNIAILPFTFNGGKADIENTLGMSQTGLDDDYGSAPKLKFNGAGDNVIVHFDSQAGEFSFLLKQNGQNAGTFTVYESANGEDYTPVWSGGDFGNAQSETIKPTLSESARYVKFEYTTKGTSTNYALGSISIAKPDNRADAGLAWNPTSVTLTQGEAFTAPTLNKPNSVSDITYESSNDEVATVTTAGVIALGSATGTATITATFDGDATYKPATATCTITVNEYIETIDGEWELVTDASKLQAGMEIIIASVEVDGKYYTMSKASDNGNNRTAVESTISGEKLNPAVGTSVLTLVDAGNGTFALQAGNGKYLYAASSTSNHLKEKDKIDVNGQWTITIADNVATIKAEGSSNRNWIRYNNSSNMFSCYASGQKDIALYAKKPAHTRTTSAGRYGTICLPGNIVKCLGATLYEVAGKDGLRVVFDEVLTPEAGMPYIFLAHNAEVLFYCGDQTVATPGYHKSLHGTFTVLQNSELAGMYMVQNNKIVECNPANSGVAENRAYFNGTELEGLGKPGAQMPGRRRITMGTESENTATGTEDVIAPEGQTIKLIENGQLIIIRGGEKFNAQGIKF